MGLLDDLKKQAEAKQQAGTAANAAPTKNQHYKEVQKALKDALRYFAELAESLNVLKPDVRRQYYIEGSSKLTNLQQQEYLARDVRRTIVQPDDLVEVSIRFVLVGDEKLTFDKETRQANVMKEYLWAYSLPFEHRDVRDDKGRIVRTIITVLSKVPSSVTLNGNFDTGDVILTMRNLELLGDVKQTLHVKDVNEGFFEEIGKAVLGQPNALREWGMPDNAPLPASFAPPVKWLGDGRDVK